MRKNIFLLPFILMAVFACSDEELIAPQEQQQNEDPMDDPVDEDPVEVATCTDGIQNGNETGIDCGGSCPPCLLQTTISGFAQKGPFLNGSSVTIMELDSSYVATGKTFTTQILDNAGTFEVANIELISPYTALRVDGFYFNEVCGESSNAQITLNGLSDTSRSGAINLNVLTHLEKSRVEYLISNGAELTAAKAQALSEVLAIFNIIAPEGVIYAEDLDIANSSAGDAILIAVASMIQGFRTESEFSKLMANMISDIRTDGALSNSSIGADILAHSKLLDTVQIRENIENRYNDIGIAVDVPNFGSYISNFIANTSYPDTVSVINYPSNGTYGVNLLDPDVLTITDGEQISVAATLPNDCMTLKIRISGDGTNCNVGCWYYSVTAQENWSITPYNTTTHEQVFTSIDTNMDLALFFGGPGEYLVEYFENTSTIPTKTKTIIVQ